MAHFSGSSRDYKAVSVRLNVPSLALVCLLEDISNCLGMRWKSCQNDFFLRFHCRNHSFELSERCRDRWCCFHLESFPWYPTAPINQMHSAHWNANVVGGELKFHQRYIASRRQREVNQNRPDCFGELYFHVTSECTSHWTKTQGQGIHFRLWTEEFWSSVLILSVFIFFWNKYRDSEVFFLLLLLL